MDLRLAPLQTARLRLEPLTVETARAILAGDLSGLAAAGLTAADGWPHDDTADGLAMGRLVEAGEVASLVAFLSTGACPSLTGATLDINGASYIR